MLNPLYFTGRTLLMGFSINLESHNINHANSEIIIQPNVLQFGSEYQFQKKS